jgi:hypothetical protein
MASENGPNRWRARSRALVFALIGTTAGLTTLAGLNRTISTGWRMFVLDRVFKAAWAVTMAIVIAAIAQLLIRAIASSGPDDESRGRIRDVAAIFLSIGVAIAALDYFLPDWTRLSIMSGGAALFVWIVAAVATL